MAWKDNSPVPVTCPKIDNVIGRINRVYRSSEPMEKEDLQRLEEWLEEIRTHNSDLRTWGNEQYKEAERLEVENSNLTDEVEQLKKEIDNLKDEVNTINSTL